MKGLIRKLRGGSDLNSGDIRFAVPLLLSDATDDETKVAFLGALH